MKKIFTAVCIFYCAAAPAQVYTNNFEGPNNLPVYNDTMAGNIWQTGTPAKVFFDSAYSVPNAMVTDTLNPYPVNNTSSFFFSINGPFLTMWIIIQFEHKYDTDSLYDGGYIEMSSDHGMTWHNIANDPFLSSGNPYNDTISGGIKAFTGNSNGWMNTYIFFDYCALPLVVDSITFRFVFKSDSINTNKEGWMIDNIFVSNDICLGVKENPDNNIISISPNPAANQLAIGSRQQAIEGVEIYNVLGEKLNIGQLTANNNQLTLDVSKLNSGIYFVNVKTKEGIRTAKFVKE